MDIDEKVTPYEYQFDKEFTEPLIHYMRTLK